MNIGPAWITYRPSTLNKEAPLSIRMRGLKFGEIKGNVARASRHGLGKLSISNYEPTGH